MKKVLLSLGLIGCAFMAMGCGATTQTYTRTEGGLVRGSFEDVVIAAKDFESVGLVFAETQVGDGSSSNMTYDALLREAAKIGGQDIVNVVIEDVKVCEASSSGSWTSNCSVTRYGSALAIRYTDALSADHLVSKDFRKNYSGADSSMSGASEEEGQTPGFFGKLFH